MSHIFTILRDLLFPQLCAACGSRLGIGEKVLCVNCLRTFPKTFYWQQPLDNEMARLLWGKFPVERCAALYFYQPETPLANAIHSLKYNRLREVGVMFGRLMAEEMQPYGFFDGIDAIVPIPLHKNRRRHRGYNQSELLARGVAEVTHLPVWTEVVARIIDNKTLTQMDFYERRAQTEGIFECIRPEQIRGKHLLMVDDVVTLGATLSSCMKCMSGLGVRFSVLTLAAARAPIDFPGFVHYDFDV